MRITIGRFDPATGAVAVTFAHLGVKHRRTVNACLDAGQLDRAATRARLEEVGRGVERKITLGLLG